ncbi:MAG: transcriptional repressor [Gemmatimonadota bacterium]|nr:transcriptional repressor [Gemmatimonadota bacterium]MDH5758097.1 transcriptional repressor [Gemmatimonadota bacterium]
MHSDTRDLVLRRALERHGHRFTEQRAAVHRFLSDTFIHPTADEVFLSVRRDIPGISLATVYKSLETLVGCGLATKLSFSDGSARYDGRTDPHHHVRCLECGRVMDVPGRIPERDLQDLERQVSDFMVTGYRLELSGYCAECAPAAPTRASG